LPWSPLVTSSWNNHLQLQNRDCPMMSNMYRD